MRFRGSDLTDDQLVVEVRLDLRCGDRETSERQIAEIVRWRREHQPGGQNCGSVFVNPVPGEVTAGGLIDGLGLRGLRIGSASVSEKHANFIQASDGGSAADVRAVMEAVRDRVADATGFVMRSEVRLLGFPDETQPFDEPRGAPMSNADEQPRMSGAARAGDHTAETESNPDQLALDELLRAFAIDATRMAEEDRTDSEIDRQVDEVLGEGHPDGVEHAPSSGSNGGSNHGSIGTAGDVAASEHDGADGGPPTVPIGDDTATPEQTVAPPTPRDRDRRRRVPTRRGVRRG